MTQKNGRSTRPPNVCIDCIVKNSLYQNLRINVIKFLTVWGNEKRWTSNLSTNFMTGSVTLKGWTLYLLLISWQEQCYPERMKIRPTNIMAGSVTLKGWTTYYRGHLVPKLRLGPFLTLSVRNGSLGFWDPGPYPE